MKCVDLGLDLETMKGLMDEEDDTLEVEQDKLNKELTSVENSLNVLRGQNAQLTMQIGEKSTTVNS